MFDRARVTGTNSLKLGPWPDEATAHLFLEKLADGTPFEDQECLHLQRLDMEELAAWLVQHDIGALAYDRCRHAFPDLATHLRADAFSATAENSLHFATLEQIVKAFRAACIPVVLLKGAALATTVYQNWSLRPMSDIDIWVGDKDMPRAVKTMQRLGFVAYGKEARPPDLQMLSKGEIRFHKPDWQHGLVELHWSAFPGWWVQRTAVVDHKAIWARAEPLTIAGCQVYQLAAEDMIIQLAVHLAVNHQFDDISLRALMDMALLARSRTVEWHVVGERARTWQVGVAVWTALAIAAQLAGIPGLEEMNRQLSPTAVRRRLLSFFVSPQTILAGRNLTKSKARYLFLLLLVDRCPDIVRFLFRTLWPEREWLVARYRGKHNRWHHLWQVVRHGQI